jgi:hypothetical protein
MDSPQLHQVEDYPHSSGIVEVPHEWNRVFKLVIRL